MIFCKCCTLFRNKSRILHILHISKLVIYQPNTVNPTTVNTIKCTISCFQVQSIARTVLSKSFLVYKSSQRIVIPELIPMMTTPPPKVTEEQFKVKEQKRNFLKFNFLGEELFTSSFCWDLSFLLL